MSLSEKLKLKLALDPDIEAAITTSQDTAKLESELSAKQTALLVALDKAEAARDRAALPDDAGGNSKEYVKLDAEVQRIVAERNRNLAAMREAGRRKAEAETVLRKSRAGADLKTAKKFAKLRMEAMKEIVDGIAMAVEGWQKHHEYNDRTVAWRPELTSHAGGLLLRRDEIRAAIEAEIARLSAPQPLDGAATPIFPGGRSLLLGGNPQKAKPLIEIATEANAYLERRIEDLNNAPVKVPAPAPKPVATAPGEADPDALILETSGPTLSADQIQASLGRRRLA